MKLNFSFIFWENVVIKDKNHNMNKNENLYQKNEIKFLIKGIDYWKNVAANVKNEIIQKIKKVFENILQGNRFHDIIQI